MHALQAIFRCRPIVCAGAVLLLGCAATAPHAFSAAPSTTQSSSPAPRTVSFDAAAVPIDRLRGGEDHDVDLRNVINFDKRGDVYFGQAERYDEQGDVVATTPIVVAAAKGAWLALSLADPRLRDAEWQFVASGPAEGEIFGVLDDSLHHKGKVILLAHSSDSGVTWTISQVRKPFDSGDYDSFAMDKTGHGRLTVYLAPTTKHPNRAGFYHFHTADAGKSWARPEHEADALDPADDVPGDEDPEPLKSTPMQSARASAAAIATLGRR